MRKEGREERSRGEPLTVWLLGIRVTQQCVGRPSSKIQNYMIPDSIRHPASSIEHLASLPSSNRPKVARTPVSRIPRTGRI